MRNSKEGLECLIKYRFNEINVNFVWKYHSSLLQELMSLAIDIDLFVLFLKHPSLNVNYMIACACRADYSITHVSLLLEHPNISVSCVKTCIKQLKESDTKYLNLLHQFVKTVESGDKWNAKMYDNENNNNSVNIENFERNENIKTNENNWIYKELWANVILQTFSTNDSKEFPDLWLHILIKYLKINTYQAISHTIKKFCGFIFLYNVKKNS